MKKCLLCSQYFVPRSSLTHIFSWHAFQENCLCIRCLSSFERLSGQRCSICLGQLSDNALCFDCKEWGKIYGNNLLHNQALYRYNTAFHDLMVNYKRYGDYVLCQVLHELCCKELRKLKADYYIPIPTSLEHIEKRQYDTIKSIYNDIVPLTFVLQKKSGCGAQGEKNRAERLKSQQSFFVKENIKVDLNFRHIILLDDIYTTGRTLYHARDALLAAFPKIMVSSFTLCR